MRGIVAAKAKRTGFTLLELLVVLMIMVLFASLAAPSLTKLVKSSKVKQTAEIVLTALNRARNEALRWKLPVAVFYGDDPARYQNVPGLWIPNTPLSVDLPAKDQIEIWVMHEAVPQRCSDFNYGFREDGESGCNDGINTQSDAPCHWNSAGYYFDNETDDTSYPYCVRLTPVTTDPLIFPDGVRIIGCSIESAYQQLYFNNYGGLDPIKELKRHNSAYDRFGGQSNNGDAYAFSNVLIYDVATGEHIVIQVGEWKNVSRPVVILDSSVTGQSLMGWSICNLSGAWTTLTKFTQLDSLMAP